MKKRKEEKKGGKEKREKKKEEKKERKKKKKKKSQKSFGDMKERGGVTEATTYRVLNNFRFVHSSTCNNSGTHRSTCI